MVAEHFPELIPVLSQISVASWISDIIRYHVLLQYGGVYLDLDERAVRDFTPLMGMFNSSFTVCETPWVTPPLHPTSAVAEKGCESIAPGIIAAPAGHPALRCAAIKSIVQSKWGLRLGLTFDVSWTGPPLWT